VKNAAFVCLALVALTGSAPAQAPARNRHVVVISIDGFSAYSLKDPVIAVPNIRRLVASGVAAEAMVPVNPTVTWPNHTSIVSGVPPAKHTVIYNGWAVRAGEGEPLRVEPHVPRRELVSGKTIYDVAREQGLTTAEVDWVAVENAENITFSFPEWPSVNGKIEKEMMAAGLVTAEDIQGFAKRQIVWRDEIWTRAGEHIIETHKPNLLLFHLLTTDSAQHTYGARSLAGNTALALADAKVGRLIDATKRAGIFDRTTFVIVSDHGFKTYKRSIRPNALLKQKGLGKSAWVIPEGGTAMVYVTSNTDKKGLVSRLTSEFSQMEGVSRVVAPEEFASLGLPDPAKNNRMADLVLAAHDGYSFSGAPDGEPIVSVPAGATPGAHGYLNTDPEMYAILVLSGSGIRKGAKLGTARNIDVAPTIARLLGVTLSGAEGKVLSDVLE
jgi:predicted AlkP superfamily pyrophosphatase or phosphodiesterase